MNAAVKNANAISDRLTIATRGPPGSTTTMFDGLRKTAMSRTRPQTVKAPRLAKTNAKNCRNPRTPRA